MTPEQFAELTLLRFDQPSLPGDVVERFIPRIHEDIEDVFLQAVQTDRAQLLRELIAVRRILQIEHPDLRSAAYLNACYLYANLVEEHDQVALDQHAGGSSYGLVAFFDFARGAEHVLGSVRHGFTSQTRRYSDMARKRDKTIERTLDRDFSIADFAAQAAAEEAHVVWAGRLLTEDPSGFRLVDEAELQVIDAIRGGSPTVGGIMPNLTGRVVCEGASIAGKVYKAYYPLAQEVMR